MKSIINASNSGVPLEGLGRWSSEDLLPAKVQPARDATAVKKEWKDDDKNDLFLIELEVKAGSSGVQTRRGENGAVYDDGITRRLPGGVIQHELIDTSAAKNNLTFRSFKSIKKEIKDDK